MISVSAVLREIDALRMGNPLIGRGGYRFLFRVWKVGIAKPVASAVFSQRIWSAMLELSIDLTLASYGQTGGGIRKRRNAE